ncbi:MAG: lipoprotein signal peptidase [Bacteroidota bacterium]|nr:lipoprotein signal peptidase [Bacteroidota bacterium]
MKKYFPFLLIGLVLLLDQLLKFWVKANMQLGTEINMIGDWAILHFTENNGIAFGLEFDWPMGKLFLTFFRILAASFILYYLLRLRKYNTSEGLVISVALIFAGAMGNIIDSIFYGEWFKEINSYPGGIFHGRVVDMFYFPILEGVYPEWVPFVGGEDYIFFRPVFNIADTAITVGVLMILFFFRKSLKSPDKLGEDQPQSYSREVEEPQVIAEEKHN